MDLLGKDFKTFPNTFKELNGKERTRTKVRWANWEMNPRRTWADTGVGECQRGACQSWETQDWARHREEQSAETVGVSDSGPQAHRRNPDSKKEYLKNQINVGHLHILRQDAPCIPSEINRVRCVIIKLLKLKPREIEVSTEMTRHSWGPRRGQERSDTWPPGGRQGAYRGRTNRAHQEADTQQRYANRRRVHTRPHRRMALSWHLLGAALRESRDRDSMSCRDTKSSGRCIVQYGHQNILTLAFMFV